jgi:hypothetical protein
MRHLAGIITLAAARPYNAPPTNPLATTEARPGHPGYPEPMTIPLFLASEDTTHYLLQDIGLCIVAATLLAYVARLLRQPLLLAYIGAGVIIGPLCLNWIHNAESIPVLAELGLAFLMFIVGLEIDI